MKTLKITALAAIALAAGTALCHAQSDPDCTPSAQRVFHDAEATFRNDQTMQDILAYAIAKCSVYTSAPAARTALLRRGIDSGHGRRCNARCCSTAHASGEETSGADRLSATSFRHGTTRECKISSN
jgi:hypothetical protein